MRAHARVASRAARRSILPATTQHGVFRAEAGGGWSLARAWLQPPCMAQPQPSSREARAFTEPQARSVDETRERLLRSKINELNLKIEGSRLQPLVQQLYGELTAAGIDLKPPVYLSDEWGCPDGVPLIGVPFYLVDERLAELQKELVESVEAETDADIMAYLRHETGHAINYAYRLHDSEEWHSTFGPYSRPYLDDYTPYPFSRSYVRHIPGWYAQKHPDEDFAETFAVWLTPGSNWRHDYADWGCLEKLQYVERTMKRIGKMPPLVSVNYDESQDLAHLLSEHFERLRYAPAELPAYFDGDLKELFGSCITANPSELLPAHTFIAELRRPLTAGIAYWTGLSENVIRSLLEHLAERARVLELCLPLAERARLSLELSTYATTLCMNRLYKGDFVVK